MYNKPPSSDIYQFDTSLPVSLIKHGTDEDSFSFLCTEHDGADSRESERYDELPPIQLGKFAAAGSDVVIASTTMLEVADAFVSPVVDITIEDRAPLIMSETDTVSYADRIKPAAMNQILELDKAGWNIRPEPVEDPQALVGDDDLEARTKISRLEIATRRAMNETSENPDILYHPELLGHPAPAINEGVGSWGEMRMTAAALHDLYNAADVQTLGQGINPVDFTKNIIRTPDGVGGIVMEDAVKALYDIHTSTADADKIFDSYMQFICKPVDAASRELFQGCIDGKSIRTRAITAMNMIERHLAENGKDKDQDLVSVSLACGAAAPVYLMADKIEEQGGKFSKMVLADMDPMALACAYSLATPERRETLEVHRRNLLRNDLTEYIAPKSADVVDILGLFEYLHPKTAANFLKNVSEIVKPGGLIVLGNMLDERPEQTFFKDVVKWPSVKQRSIAKTLAIVEDAGFNKENMEIVVPSKEGVYAVVAIKVPEA